MKLSDCYRLLGLSSGASFEDVKAAYRRLVRRYHPDVNPGNVEWAKEKFIELTDAYRRLVDALGESKPTRSHHAATAPTPTTGQAPPPHASSTTRVNVSRKAVPFQPNPALSDIENHLKQQTYLQLQQFLKDQRFPRAIALVEGLAQRIPQDPEVKQWQAIAYQRWGRHLVDQQQFSKARIYLKKALKVDPQNRSLWSEVQRDFDRMERMRLRRI